MRIDCFHDAAAIDALIQNAEQVARRSYQRGLGVGFSASAEMRQRLLLEGARGTLRAHILYAGDQPCAFWIASLFNGVLYNDFMAYDPAFAKYAPGMYLVICVIDEVSRDPNAGAAPAIDFGVGEAEWKARLGNESWEEASLYFYAPTVKGMGVKAMRTAAVTAERLVKAGLNLLPRVKRLWRKRMSRG
jgi:CelD/BcsL family acetyltransferase involved in cellulose biosynthesis